MKIFLDLSQEQSSEFRILRLVIRDLVRSRDIVGAIKE
jgi:hypothetical protein